LNAEWGRVVRARLNNFDRASSGAPQFGVYIHLQPTDGTYAKTHFPEDPDGNLYRGQAPGILGGTQHNDILAYLGTNETIAPLLQAFHDDPSPMVRERAACSLAQSGMLTQEQRHSVIPHLLDYADDTSLDPQTQGWVYQALRDISGKNLPNDSSSWRNWYSSAGS